MSFFRFKSIVDKLKEVCEESKTLFFTVLMVMVIGSILNLFFDAGLVWCGFYALHSVFEKVPKLSFIDALWFTLALHALRAVLTDGGEER